MIFDVQRGGPSTGMPTRTQQADILSCAYASHGDTKHVLLLPEDPHESFALAAEAFDLADRLQTPIFVMLDLDIGMNDWLVSRSPGTRPGSFDRGKVMTAEELEAGRSSSAAISMSTATASPIALFPARIRRVAAISPAAPRRTAMRATRGGRRLRRQHAAPAAQIRDRQALVPRPGQARWLREPTKYGAIYFGSTAPAMDEALETLEERGIHLDTLRLRAFPFRTRSSISSPITTKSSSSSRTATPRCARC